MEEVGLGSLWCVLFMSLGSAELAVLGGGYPGPLLLDVMQSVKGPTVQPVELSVRCTVIVKDRAVTHCMVLTLPFLFRGGVGGSHKRNVFW